MKKKFLSKAEIDKLPTKRVLAYKNSLYKAHETPGFNNPSEVAKNTAAWKQAMLDAKAVLATRVHVQRLNVPVKRLKAPPEKWPSFNVGATVRVESKGREYHNGVGTVTSIDGIICYVTFPNGHVGTFGPAELVQISTLDAIARVSQ